MISDMTTSVEMDSNVDNGFWLIGTMRHSGFEKCLYWASRFNEIWNHAVFLQSKFGKDYLFTITDRRPN